MINKSEPQWLLSDGYGVGIDALNWRLYRGRLSEKHGTMRWRIIAYFATLRELVTYLQETILLEDSECDTLKEHINTALERWEACSEALKNQLDSIAAGLDTLPPKYASFPQSK
jgi:hypothetical protein